MGSTLIEILQESEERLAGVDSPRLSAELLLCEVLGCSRLMVTLERNRVLSAVELDEYQALVARREKGEPIAYILGRKEFYGLDFGVTADTLIPRPETEHIVEEVEARFSPDTSFRFADLGTGSGILAITLAHLFPQARGVAVDMSEGALRVARANAETHDVEKRVEFQKGDFTLPLFPTESFDLIVSNPPYVTRQDFENASREVTAFEPETALTSGDDGLDHIRSMLPHVVFALKDGGFFFMEIGYQQGDAVCGMITTKFPECRAVSIKKDLSGHDRIVVLQK